MCSIKHPIYSWCFNTWTAFKQGFFNMPHTLRQGNLVWSHTFIHVLRTSSSTCFSPLSQDQNSYYQYISNMYLSAKSCFSLSFSTESCLYLMAVSCFWIQKTGVLGGWSLVWGSRGTVAPGTIPGGTPRVLAVELWSLLLVWEGLLSFFVTGDSWRGIG